MSRILKKLIVPSIIVILFAFVYLIIIPYVQRRNAKESVFKKYETALTNLGITFTKEELDAKEFGAWKAYLYTSSDKKAKLYVFDKDSKSFEKALQDYYVTSVKNSDNRLYGVIYGHCVISIDEGFPNEEQLLVLFGRIVNDYENSIK